MSITEAARVLKDCAATERYGPCDACRSVEVDRFAYARFLDKVKASPWIQAGCTSCGYSFVMPKSLIGDDEWDILPKSGRDDFTRAVAALHRENREILNTIEDLS